MKSNSILKQGMGLTAVVLMLVFCFSACKKEQQQEEPLPVLGTCNAVAPQGRLSYNDTAFVYHTSGGGHVRIDLRKFYNVLMTHDSMPNFKVEFWGEDGAAIAGNHENLNGKHIKDRFALRRTFVFPDGAKVTFVASDTFGALVSISIYDGKEAHHINTSCNKLEYSSGNSSFTSRLDEQQPDGETAAIELTATGLLFVNIYQEDTVGNKVYNRVLLGELFTDTPNRVNDYYDDPRFGGT